MIDITALSYWYPRLRSVGLPMPRTTLVEMPQGIHDCLLAAMDGQDGGDNPEPFFDAIREAAEPFGFPFFLRTDHLSGKHRWNRACFVPDAASIASHVFNIAEQSELNSFVQDIPWNTWAVRELLPTKPLGICPHYGDMPICREFRFFVVEDVEPCCMHPYWPRKSLVQGGADPDSIELCKVYETTWEERRVLWDLARSAASTLGGAWSIDILETARGWFIIDLAEAHKSFHWEGCREARRFEQGAPA